MDNNTKKFTKATNIHLSDKGISVGSTQEISQEETSKESIENKKNNFSLEQYRETRRLHYDNLLWKTTSLFIGFAGVMLAFIYSKDMSRTLSTDYIFIYLFGFIFTMITFCFAVSFRELRHNLGNPPCEKGLPKIILKQWFLFVLLFLFLEFMWIYPLIKYSANGFLWTLLLCVGIIITLLFDMIVNGIKDSIRNYCDDKLDELKKQINNK